MPAKRPYFPESAMAHRWLDHLGNGIEIGASAHNAFNLPNQCVFVDYTNHMNTVFKLEEIRLCGEAQRVDVVAEADNLPFPDQSQDYVLSSHLFEHLPDPIRALKEWIRVLRPGGIIFLIIPNWDHPSTFAADKARGLSTLERIDRDYRDLNTIENYPDTDVGLRGHYHLFNLATFEEFIRARFAGRLEIVDGLAADDKVMNGFTSVLRAIGNQQPKREDA